MRLVTIGVDEETNAAFEEEARKRGVSVAALIGYAMQEYKELHLSNSPSLFDHPPASVGTVISELGPEDDLMDEMSAITLEEDA